MGFKSYLMPAKADKTGKAKPETLDEKATQPASTTLSPPMVPTAVPNMLSPRSGNTPSASRPASIYPAGDYRNAQAADILDIKCDIMVNYLHTQQMQRLWTTGGADEGVVLKKSRDIYTCSPAGIDQEPDGFFNAVRQLNVRCAMTMNTRTIKLFLHDNQSSYVPFKNGLRLQVLPDITYLPTCAKHQFAAFIADRGMLVVWDDEPKHLLVRGRDIETSLMQMIWPDDDDPDEENEKEGAGNVVVQEVTDELDPEALKPEKPRPLVFIQACLSAITLGLTIVAIGLGWRRIAVEIFYDHNYLRLAFLAATPLQIWLGLFFFQSLVGSAFQLFGPISQVNKNTRYYSGVPPRRLHRDLVALPHVTIQMPVYKEGLTAVIEPTIASIKDAISTYEMQGGTANIFINDDGMQLISEEDARARQDFYDEHNIGWVARPRHDPRGEHGDAFVRGGKFKKASNMNYSMWISTRVEDKLARVERHADWIQQDEAHAYRQALVQVVEEDEGRTWADGNIRIGDYILIIDSDTRVPEDCFLSAVSEMNHSPEVAILQYASGVMNVTTSFFERGITFFTNLIYSMIRYSVSNGDVAPFVGHNAILRWTAVQNVAFHCEIDNREKWWSEDTVSEDFDIALRLQSEGYNIRLAGYTGDGFKEGVSLTVYDELARWEKYAYGCSELLFNPFIEWPRKGPLTKIFKNFLRSNIPLPSKITIMAYIGTYYAIGSACWLTLLNYFLSGWFNGHLDHYYLDSFKVYISIIAVFSCLGNFSLAVFRYRAEGVTLYKAFIENFIWVPLLVIFLGGVSVHVSQALLSHILSIDMTWGATSKEETKTPFFQEIPKVAKMFKWTFLSCILMAVMMVVLAFLAPDFWRIRLFIAVFPLSMMVVNHFALPILLNPNLMLFTW